ncbi:hypothetical protein NL676_030987 [Syzygium grande]|nr:hypothetical protein NL676_030987 [Syzygium grande]
MLKGLTSGLGSRITRGDRDTTSRSMGETDLLHLNPSIPEFYSPSKTTEWFRIEHSPEVEGTRSLCFDLLYGEHLDCKPDAAYYAWKKLLRVRKTLNAILDIEWAKVSAVICNSHWKWSAARNYTPPRLPSLRSPSPSPLSSSKPYFPALCQGFFISAGGGASTSLCLLHKILQFVFVIHMLCVRFQAKGQYKGPWPKRDLITDWVPNNDGFVRSLPIYVRGVSLLAVLFNRPQSSSHIIEFDIAMVVCTDHRAHGHWIRDDAD